MAPPKGHAPYNKNGEGGRPKTYTDEWIEEESFRFEEWVEQKDTMFIEEYCFDKRIPEARFYEFIKKNDRFREAYDRFQLKQKTILFKGSLSRKMFHPMCALILSHKHNIQQKTEQKITTDATTVSLFTSITDKSEDLTDGPISAVG